MPNFVLFFYPFQLIDFLIQTSYLIFPKPNQVALVHMYSKDKLKMPVSFVLSIFKLNEKLKRQAKVVVFVFFYFCFLKQIAKPMSVLISKMKKLGDELSDSILSLFFALDV